MRLQIWSAFYRSIFQTKDLGSLQNFLDIKVAKSRRKITFFTKKYVLDMLFEASMLRCKAVDALIEANVKLLSNQREILDNPDRYRQLLGTLNYLTVTRPDIVFVVSVIINFSQHQGQLIRMQ